MLRAIALGLRDKAHCPTIEDEGHWIRAPFEVGKPHVDGLRSRLVELRIDDLAGLVEVFGMEMEFWMVKDSVNAGPRWVLPVHTITLGVA